MQSSLMLLIGIPCVFAASLHAAMWKDEIGMGAARFEQGRYSEAVEHYERALSIAGSPAERGNTIYRLAVAHCKLSDFPAAKREYTESATIFFAARNGPDEALGLAGLGKVYLLEHRPNDALKTAQRAWKVLVDHGLSQTGVAAAVLNVRGSIFFAQRRYRSAEHDLRDSADLLEMIKGPEDPELAMSLHNLAAIAEAQNHLPEAQDLFERALHIRQARFPPNHPLIAKSLLDLCHLYRTQKRYQEAEQACRDSIGILRRIYPAGQPDLIEDRTVLAMIAHDRGDVSTALKMLEALVKSVPDEPATSELARAMKLYSSYLVSAGDIADGRRAGRRAQELAEQLGRPTQATSTITVEELTNGISSK